MSHQETQGWLQSWYPAELEGSDSKCIDEIGRGKASYLKLGERTIENIKAGNSNMRNPILASFAAKLLPYRGLPSGDLRVMQAWPQTELIDDRAGNLFKAIVVRASVQQAQG